MLKEILEAIGNYATPEEIGKAIKKLKNNEPFRVAVLNRERTNHDSGWQADYFYGDKKDMSKEQSKLVVQGMIDLEKMIGKRVSTENLVKFYLDNQDPKKYFKNMR